MARAALIRDLKEKLHRWEGRDRSSATNTVLSTGLPELDRYLVYMRYFRLASADEIARKTGLNRHAIDTRLWRARTKLRDALGEHAHERVRSL